MKTLPSILLAGAIALVGTAAIADVKTDKTKSHKNWTERMFKKLDTNKDGIISKEEYAKRGAERFKKKDKDKNGKITSGEYTAAAVERAMKRAKRRFKKLDTDQNGVLDVNEASVRRDKRFSRIDANHNGKITRTKIEAAKKMFHRARYKK